MSRVSQKTGLSPSATRGSSGIDLGKNSGVDMGRKAQPSVTSGGIGITQEVANVGGASVSLGAGVEISPVNLGISVDPSGRTTTVATGAEIPGGVLGLSGGVTIDLNTGQVIGGSIGAEVAGLGINLSNSRDGGLGIEFTLQIPGTPIELSLGLGFPPDPKEPTPTPTPTPTTPTPTPSPNNSPLEPEIPPPPFYPLIGTKTFCKVVTEQHYRYWSQAGSSLQKFGLNNERKTTVSASYNKEGLLTGSVNFARRDQRYNTYFPELNHLNEDNRNFIIPMDPYPNRLNPNSRNGLEIRDIGGGAFEIKGSEQKIYDYLRQGYQTRSFDFSGEQSYPWDFYKERYFNIVSIVLNLCEPTPTPAPAPFPNSPPRKNKKMDECCRINIRLGRQNKRFLQELMIMFGRPLDSKGDLVPIPSDAKYFGEPIERIKTPIEDIASPEKEILAFKNYYELSMYNLRQQINLDVAIDPQSYEAPTGKLQNPNYQRDSEQSLESNIQPDEDKKGNKRELKIGEDIKINSISQQQQYLFQAVKRLEYLFPAGELSDAKFDKSLIIPGAKGELQIHNLIHFKEFLVQFLNATLGNPKIPVKIEDNNALKEGKQEATFNHFSISQMIRELYKIVLESGDDINAIMETTIRDFRTNLANRIQIVQIAEMTQALVEDTGMLEDQVFIPLKLDGDPYAGKWKPGVGFEPDEDLDKNEEKATEKLMRATLKNFQTQIKVIRRDKRENADTRDLLLQLAEMFIRSTAIPATKEGIEKALATAKFKAKVDNAITRSQVKRAAAAKLSRTKKRRK